VGTTSPGSGPQKVTGGAIKVGGGIAPPGKSQKRHPSRAWVKERRSGKKRNHWVESVSNAKKKKDDWAKKGAERLETRGACGQPLKGPNDVHRLT